MFQHTIIYLVEDEIIRNIDNLHTEVVENALFSFLRSYIKDDDIIEFPGSETILDSASSAQDLEEIEDIITDYYDDIKSWVDEHKKNNSFVLEFTLDNKYRFIFVVPDVLLDMMNDYLEYFDFDFVINDDYDDFSEYKGIIEELQNDWRDAEEERRDPYGYRGLSRRDFY